MYIQFDKHNMHVQVICGTLEKYTPKAEHKKIHKKVEALKKKLVKFQSEVIQPKLQEIDELIHEANPKVETQSEEN